VVFLIDFSATDIQRYASKIMVGSWAGRSSS